MPLAGPARFAVNAVTRDVLTLVESRFGDHFGRAEPFWFAVTGADAERALTHFVETGLAGFGDYQDAMLSGEAFPNHTVVSQYLNVGLLAPLDVCWKVEDAFQAGRAPLTRPRASFARSSAGESSYAVSIGGRCRIMRRPISLATRVRYRTFTRQPKPNSRASGLVSVRPATRPMRTTSSG